MTTKSSTFILEDGDGEPEFMKTSHVLRPYNEGWLVDAAAQDAMPVFEIIGGAFAGRQVGLTARRQQSIAAELEAFGLASVVVHLLEHSSEGCFPASDSPRRSIGMTILRRHDDPRF